MNQKKGFTPIIIILVLLILFIIGFIVYKTYWPKVSVTVPPQNYEECLKSPGSVVMAMYPAVCVAKSGARFTEPLTTEQQKDVTPPTATTDPTTNWKTYTNTKLGFSFKYPSEWELPNGMTIPNTKVGNTQQISFDHNLTVMYQPSTTLEQYVAKNLPTDNTPPADYINGNIHGEKIIYKSGVDQATINIVIAFSGQTQNVITFTYTDYPGQITESKIIDQILSTFQFTR